MAKAEKKVEKEAVLKPALNDNTVPVEQWKKWCPEGRRTFNWLYALMMNDPGLFTHPKAEKLKPVHWKTVAWNSAWLAADATSAAIKRVGRKLDARAVRKAAKKV